MTPHLSKRLLTTTAALAMTAQGVNAQETGPGTWAEPYTLPVAPGVRTVSVLTVGDSPSDGSGYRLVGRPDGLGIRPNGDGTFDLLMNHELSAGDGVVHRHGQRGAFVSQWTLDAQLNVLAGRDLIHTSFRFDRPTQSFVAEPIAFTKFCSSDLAPPGAFLHQGLGTAARIYLTGEETRPPNSVDHGRAFACVLDEGGANAYELPWMGRIAFENVLASPTPQAVTVVMATDDADWVTDPNQTPSPSELYMYLGLKRAGGTEIERAGLVGGSLYGLRVPIAGVEESSELGFGETAYDASARFEMFPFGDVSDRTGVQLQSESVDAGVYRFHRIEDGAWDPRPGYERDFYFVTTGRFADRFSRVFRLRFDDLSQPQLGGDITIVLDGNTGYESLDNCAFDQYGHLLLQEDPGSSPLLAGVWQLSVDTGALKQIARANPAYFSGGGPSFLTTTEELSGIVDASAVLGRGWFFLDVQVGVSLETELHQMGQLVALYNPDSGCVADFNADSVLDNGDIQAFVGAFLAGSFSADLNGDSLVDNGDIGLFVGLFLDGC